MQQWQIQQSQIQTAELQIKTLLPDTGMNNSGAAVAAFLKQHPIDPVDILLVHDDVELPLGKWQLKKGGSAVGHNGVRSIQQTLETADITRLRIGIGRPTYDQLDQFVLERFTPAEEAVLREIIPKLLQVITDYCLASAPKITNT